MSEKCANYLKMTQRSMFAYLIVAIIGWSYWTETSVFLLVCCKSLESGGSIAGSLHDVEPIATIFLLRSTRPEFFLFASKTRNFSSFFNQSKSTKGPYFQPHKYPRRPPCNMVLPIRTRATMSRYSKSTVRFIVRAGYLRRPMDITVPAVHQGHTSRARKWHQPTDVLDFTSPSVREYSQHIFFFIIIWKTC